MSVEISIKSDFISVIFYNSEISVIYDYGADSDTNKDDYCNYQK